jgi:hypothetical protein
VHWPADRERVFRFFRTHQHVTVVTGSGDWNSSAAERLTKIVAPWNIHCSTITAAEANQPRALSADEARTWVGLDFAGHDQIQAGASNPPVQAGFAVQGAVILLGTPADNPVIKFLADQHFLPFQPDAATMPGPGRGYVAWQREGIGVNQESITLIAYDKDGMSEAVGTLYEMLAGLEQLTPLTQASSSVIQPATRAAAAPELAPAWELFLEDRTTGLRASGGKLLALTAARTLTEVGSDGVRLTSVSNPANFSALAQESKPDKTAALEQARKTARPGRLPKLAVESGTITAVAYWGGLLELSDKEGKVVASRQGPQDLTALAWFGRYLVAGDADGRLSAFKLPAQ